MLAHQEVIFGSTGQTLTIRQDSSDRSSLCLECSWLSREFLTFTGVDVGLETLMDV
ncbi:MAG: hypothetical protein CM15mP49_27130 [Actinomycetota bacterium]|nr:MAG: hypothetical protein CM15mP49_27130 [Actinomycetota bacterium]